ncbi:LacI family transcriptional regulator [Verrucomicrobium sp. GAS474]|uniref:XylR family transcriptional regulator n=1 Tax=Verrucomicrobium sp. GAS474 TaxID=1882831 RepID=UPI00087A5401|nr:XylR family transcriptional regulator [Verrucomicrobium sp. GAS474]SDT98814.1 LacI family transcriptional regulator [Verrucomicrobium sp. GAS474]
MARRPPVLSRTPHVALLIETSKFYGRESLLGISTYARLHGGWSIYAVERGQNDPDPGWLANWKGDGIITRSFDLKLCRRAQKRGIPVVSLRHLVPKPEFPSFFPDQVAIANRVARHFIERGVRRFAYMTIPGDRGWEEIRRAAFVQVLQKEGMPAPAIRLLSTEAGMNWEHQEGELVTWLRQLPKPVGIMTSHDAQGLLVLDACRRAGIRVPDDVAVVSVDNDPVLCEISAPPLSSLDQNVQKIGFEAAAALDRMMRGEACAAKNYFIEPGDVVTRQSSDVLMVDDPGLAKAIRFVREAGGKGIGVNDMARVAGMSRRALEMKFVKVIGRTPLEEIQEIRYRRTRHLLLETNYTLPQIAELVGIQYHEYLVRFFKKRSGMTPGEFRRRMG